MKILKTAIAALFIVAANGAAHAQDAASAPPRAETAIKVATGKSDATNSQMFAAIKQACPGLTQEVTEGTTGGLDNMNMLLGNKVDAGIAQVDVAEFLQATDPNVSKLRSLVALNPNHLHIIASTRGMMIDPGKPANRLGFGAVEPTFVPINTLLDLKGKTVVAHGSAQITARQISKKLSLNLTIVDDDSDKRDGLAKIKTGEAAAFFAMGGKPVSWVEKLNGQDYALVPVPAEAVAMLGSPYFSQKLTYKNMGAFGLPTVSVNNELFVRNYQGSKAKQLADLRACYLTNVLDIKETTGTHAAWQEVGDLNDTKWQKFEAPNATPTAIKVKK